MPRIFDEDEMMQQVEQTYDAEVAAVIPHSDELMALGSKGVFVLQYPNNEVATKLQYVADRLAE